MNDEDHNSSEIRRLRSQFDEYQEQQQTLSQKRRDENIRILISLGIVGLAGTLYAQGSIGFPTLSSLSSSESAKSLLRMIVYVNIFYLMVKIVFPPLRKIIPGNNYQAYEEYIGVVSFVLPTVIIVLAIIFGKIITVLDIGRFIRDIPLDPSKEILLLVLVSVVPSMGISAYILVSERLTEAINIYSDIDQQLKQLEAIHSEFGTLRDDLHQLVFLDMGIYAVALDDGLNLSNRKFAKKLAWSIITSYPLPIPSEALPTTKLTHNERQSLHRDVRELRNNAIHNKELDHVHYHNLASYIQRLIEKAQ